MFDYDPNEDKEILIVCVCVRARSLSGGMGI